MKELLDGLEKQLSIYKDIFALTVTEKEAFVNKNNELFLETLTERLKLMGEINLTEKEVKPLREEWLKNKGNFSDFFNKMVLEKVKLIKELMDKIFALENLILAEKAKEQQEVIDIPKKKAINNYKKI